MTFRSSTLPFFWAIFGWAVFANAAAPDSMAASQPSDVRFGPLPHTNTVFTPASYGDLSTWQTRRDWLRDQVRLAAGLIPEPPALPLDAQIFGKLERDGYKIEKVYFRSSPGLYVTGNLFRPAAASGRRPAVACPHGHWRDGRLHHDETGSVPARCITLARAGAVVFAYDMIGRNDAGRTFQHGDTHLDTPEAALWGIGHLQLQTLNSLRVIDFLRSLPDVDPERIGVTGASGGGTQTFVLGAIDDRVAVDCPVNMISSTMQGGCICENAPLLRIGTNNMEIAALFAPRPQLMVSASGDWTKLTPTVEFPFVRSIYELYGAADRVANVHVDAGHNYNRQSREAMYHFLGRWLLRASVPDAITEGEIRVEKPEDMLVFDDKNTPADMATAEELVRLTREQIRGQIREYMPTSASKLEALTRIVRLWLAHATGSRIPDDLDIGMPAVASTVNERGYLKVDSTQARNGRILKTTSFAARPDGSRTAPKCSIVIVDPDGKAAAEKHRGLIEALCKKGHHVAVAEPFGTGENRRGPVGTRPSGEQKFFTTFNPTDDAETLNDILTAVFFPPSAAMGHMRGATNRVRLVGFGRMGPLCLAAGALIPKDLGRKCDLRVLADVGGHDWSADATYVDQCFIPQIQRFGGLPAIAAVAAHGPLWLHNTGGKFDTAWLEAAQRITKADVRITADRADVDAMVKWLTATE